MFCVRLCCDRHMNKWDRPVFHFLATRLCSSTKGTLKSSAVPAIRELDLLPKYVGSGEAKNTLHEKKRLINREGFFLISALQH